MGKINERALNNDQAAIQGLIGAKEYTQEELDNIDKYLALSLGVSDRAAGHQNAASMFSPVSNGSREPSKAVLLAREINNKNNRGAFQKTMDSIKDVFANIFDKKTENEQEGLPSRGGSTASFEQFEVPNIDQDVKKGNKFDNDGLQR